MGRLFDQSRGVHGEARNAKHDADKDRYRLALLLDVLAWFRPREAHRDEQDEGGEKPISLDEGDSQSEATLCRRRGRDEKKTARHKAGPLKGRMNTIYWNLLLALLPLQLASA